MLHMRLTAPEALEACAGFVRLETSRYLREAQEINRISDPEELMKILDRGLDPLNVALVREKFLEYREKTVPMLLEGLKPLRGDSFEELAVELLYISGKDCADEVIEMIECHQRDAYIVSLLCLLLGFYEHPKIPKLLWDLLLLLQDPFPVRNVQRRPASGAL